MTDRDILSRQAQEAPHIDPVLQRKAVGLIQAGRLLEAAQLLESAAHEAVQPGTLLLEAGRLFLRTGDKATALKCFEQAVATDPTLAAAQSNLGLLLAEQGNLRAGLAALEAAFALKPDDPGIAVNLSAVEVSINPPRAIERLRELLVRHPGHRLALINLASATYKSGLYDEAIASFDRLIAKEPGNLLWRLQRAAAFFGDGRLAEAQLAYQEVLDRDPTNRQALARLARLHRVAGDSAGESRYQRRLLTLDPHHVGALVGLARLAPPTAEERALMERLAATPTRRASERYPLHYALFDLADRERDVDRVAAFAHLAEANRLKAEANEAGGRVYDPTAEEVEVERLMRVFDAGWFDRLARVPSGVGHPSERPVFVVGMPRSGTTLCEQILVSHSQIGGLGERVDIARIAEELALEGGGAWPDAIAALEPDRFRAKAVSYLQLLDRSAPGALRVIDKTPTNFRYLGVIAAMFPNARIIHARRHPLDVCLSCFEQDFSESYRWSNDLGDLGHYFGLYRRLMAHWQKHLPLPILDWSYEEVVEDLEPAARRLLTFCGLDFEPGCLAFHRTRRPIHTASLEQVRQPLYKSSVGKWRRYAAMLTPLVNSLRASGVADL